MILPFIILPFMILSILRMGPGMCFDCLSRIPFGQRGLTETAGKCVDECAATGDRRYVSSMENEEEDERVLQGTTRH